MPKWDMFDKKKLPRKEGSVRQCVVIQLPVLLSPNFGAKSLHIFTQTSSIITLLRQIDFFTCQDELFMSNPLDIKENDEHALEFELHLSHLFRSR
jgi:hypothetical protein